MTKKLWVILAIGVLLRLILAFSTYHSDVQPFDLAGQVIARGNILNYYDYLPSLPTSDPILKTFPSNLFNYPPAVYFFLGFTSLVFTLPTETQFHWDFLLNLPQTLGSLQLNFHLLLLKLPYLFFDLGLAYLLLKIFPSPKEKFLAFTLWIFNPINLYATYMMGQFDVIPAFFVVLALYLVSKNIQPNSKNLNLAALSLGLGGAFKIYPLFLLFPLACLCKNWGERIRVLLLGILPYILIILPFLPSKGFRATALVASQTLKSLYSQVPISGGESIMLFPAFIIFFYLVFLKFTPNIKNLWQYFFIILLLFFVFTHYHPQWFLWLTPFLIFELIHTNFKNVLVAILSLFSFIGLVFFFDPGMTVWIFAPVFPNLYGLPSVWQMIGREVDYNVLRSILQTIFVGSAFYFIYYYFPKRAE